MNRTLLLALISFFNLTKIYGQVNSDQYQLVIKKTQEVITLDGELNEETWVNADVADNFITTFPVDSTKATSQTEMRLSYDENFIYIAGVCYVNSDKKHLIESLRRDFNWSINDNLSVYIDPFNDYTNGFTFGITPLGVVREGLVTNGRNVSSDWDNKWFSKVKDFGDRWQFEMKIPFKTIRYNENSMEWNLIFLRKDLKNNEESTWAPVPQGYRPSSLAFAGKGLFDKSLKKAGPNVVLIPFTSFASSKDYENNASANTDLQAGFDAKVGLSSSLNLDLTFNPDFSQVEVDQQVTNLSRFEIFFPERRQFFLENRDLFDEGGFRQSRPFFSRRIGIATDTAGNSVQVPILYGARLSGKIGKDWRVGFLNMHTKGQDGARLSGADEIDSTYKLLPQNYSVGIIQRQIFGRSNIGITAVNRQAIGYNEDAAISSSTEYNRVIGVDYNLLSEDSKWQGDMFYYQSFDEEERNDNYASGMFLGYNTTRVQLRARASATGAGYNAETGFVQRKDIIDLGTFNDVYFYPENSKIVRHGPGMGYSYKTDTEFSKTDIDYNVSYQIRFVNTSELEVRHGYNYVKLRNTFDPTSSLESDSLALQTGQDFNWRNFRISYNSDRRRLFSINADFSDGGFYNGKRRNVSARFNYRFQPYGVLTVSVDYNDLYDFPEPFKETEFWLIGPRLDLTFTDKLFLTTFVQYNEQGDNMNLNARLQWRFKPVSDLFVVYSDNYFPDNLKVKNRALILKLTYWLNL